jgi:hypothetical protein
VISPMQRPLLENKQQSQETDIHAHDKIWACGHSKRVAAGPLGSGYLHITVMQLKWEASSVSYKILISVCVAHFIKTCSKGILFFISLSGEHLLNSQS